MRLSVIISTLNSGLTIESRIRRLESHLQSIGLEDYEIIIVGQESDDNTFEVLRSMKTDTVKPLLIKDKGYGISLNVGLRFSIYPYILIYDLSYPKDFIDSIINEDSDIILASRYLDKSNLTFKQRWFDKDRKKVKERLTLRQEDFNTRTFLMKKQVLQRLKIDDKQDLWVLEFLHKANCLGLSIKEIPIRFSFKDKEYFDPAYIESLRERMKSEGY